MRLSRLKCKGIHLSVIMYWGLEYKIPVTSCSRLVSSLVEGKRVSSNEVLGTKVPVTSTL